jgi:hypothetical protein
MARRDVQRPSLGEAVPPETVPDSMTNLRPNVSPDRKTYNSSSRTGDGAQYISVRIEAIGVR